MARGRSIVMGFGGLERTCAPLRDFDVDHLADAHGLHPGGDSFLLAATRVSRCSLDFASVGAILVSVMVVLHVVEQCSNARQLGGEVPPMAIPGVGSAFRTTAQRGEDLVIGRSLHVTSVWHFETIRSVIEAFCGRHD
jgi:hypothetical protein